MFCRVLSKHDIRGMPVVDDTGKVVGLISYKEVSEVKGEACRDG